MIHATGFISRPDMEDKFPLRSGNPWMRRCMNRRDLGVFYRSQGFTQYRSGSDE